MDVIMEICPHIICMNFGAKIAEGTPEEIQNNPEVLSAYLGDEEADEKQDKKQDKKFRKEAISA
jgi:ABC-type multidrug transport system ATPase subunit